jgi:hypothetical protein
MGSAVWKWLNPNDIEDALQIPLIISALGEAIPEQVSPASQRSHTVSIILDAASLTRLDHVIVIRFYIVIHERAVQVSQCAVRSGIDSPIPLLPSDTE